MPSTRERFPVEGYVLRNVKAVPPTATRILTPQTREVKYVGE